MTVLKPETDSDFSDFAEKYPVTVKSLGKPRLKPFGGSTKTGRLMRKFGRALYFLMAYPDIELMWRVRQALKNENGFDMMITIAVPHTIHWGGAWARTRDNRIAKTWIADCGDPFMGLTLESFRFPFYLGYFEKWFCRKADFISVPTEGSKEAYFPDYRGKIRVIPQGFDFENVRLFEGKNERSCVHFVYAGGVSASGVRNPFKILEHMVTGDKDFRFYLYATTGRDLLKGLAEKSKGRVVICDPMPREDLLYELSKADVLVNLDNGVGTQTPSKLIDYGLTGKPIMNISGENPDYHLIDRFLTGDFSGSLAVDDISRYDIRTVSGQFLALHEED